MVVRSRAVAGAHEYLAERRRAEQTHGGTAIRVAHVGNEYFAVRRPNLSVFGPGVVQVCREGRHIGWVTVSRPANSAGLAAQLAARMDARIRQSHESNPGLDHLIYAAHHLVAAVENVSRRLEVWFRLSTERPPGYPFAPAVEAGDDLPAIDRLVAFMGRRL